MAPSRAVSLAVGVLLVHAGLAMEHGLLSTSGLSCQSEYQSILQNSIYKQPILDGQHNCSQVIEASFTIQDGAGCSPYDIMIGCFQVSTHPDTPAAHSAVPLFASSPPCIHSLTFGATADGS